MKYRVLYNNSNKRIKFKDADKAALSFFSHGDELSINYIMQAEPNKGILILPYDYIRYDSATLSKLYGDLQKNHELIVFKPRQIHFIKIIEKMYLLPNSMFINANFDLIASDDEDMFNTQLKEKYVDQVFEEIKNRNVSIEKLRFKISNYTYTIENTGNVLVDSDTKLSLRNINMLIGNALYE
ncbi:hypothetical protein [Leuconostoc mesenteroides]|uniref:hypothetical protein n=1 Tax=Leuconostoc mesenteroides TaxID=1245 RepID=UPI002360AF13|nr:hypothetical protein [Leuconostoc mesenteroides]